MSVYLQSRRSDVKHRTQGWVQDLPDASVNDGGHAIHVDGTAAGPAPMLVCPA
jgi:hypothetical protein